MGGKETNMSSGERTIHLDPVESPQSGGGKWPLIAVVVVLIIVVAYLVVETMRLKQRVTTISSQQLGDEDLKFLTDDLPGIITKQVQDTMRQHVIKDGEQAEPQIEEAEEDEVEDAEDEQRQPPPVAEQVLDPMITTVDVAAAKPIRRRSSRGKKEEDRVQLVIKEIEA